MYLKTVCEHVGLTGNAGNRNFMKMTSLHLVLMPGLDGSGKMFQPFLEQLPVECKVTVISYPGDRTIEFSDLDDYVCERLPRETPLILIGESYSGPVAVMLSQRAELDIRGIVFVATFAHFPTTFIKLLSRLLPLSLLFSLPSPDFVIKRYCFGRWATPRLTSLVRQSVSGNKPAVIAHRSRSGAAVDVRSSLVTISVPCLYIRASDDRLVPERALQDFVEHIPQLEQAEVDGPHCLLQARPRACLAAIQYFIDNISSAVAD
jgi:pimeloyl-ACP methyl ester carboxylesterase